MNSFLSILLTSSARDKALLGLVGEDSHHSIEQD